MLNIFYKPTFIRKYNKLNQLLKNEVKEKINEFRNLKNHQALKVHKLHGVLSDKYSFSVNFQLRIIFQYQKNRKNVDMLHIGNHDELYK